MSYRPVFSRQTALLWIAPIVFLLFGIGLLWLVLTRWSNGENQADAPPISEELESLFAEDNSRS